MQPNGSVEEGVKNKYMSFLSYLIKSLENLKPSVYSLTIYSILHHVNC